MKKENVETLFKRFATQSPEPKTELHYTNAYTLLVAVVLSAQSTDVGVNKATESLFKISQTPQQMLKLGEAGLKKYIKTIGLFNAKAKNIIALSKKLVDDFNGDVPHDRQALQSLAGVGRKTANVVLNAMWGEPVMAVDTHVFRVANRLGLSKGQTPEKVEDDLMKIIPKKYLRHAHHWLILHGRYVCKARKPECEGCLAADLCPSKTL